MMLSPLMVAAQSGTTDNTMNDKQQIARLYEDILRYMITKDTVSLGALLSDDSVLVHMTGYRQSKGEYLREIATGVLNYYSAQTDSIEVTVDGDKARLIGRSRVNADCGRRQSASHRPQQGERRCLWRRTSHLASADGFATGAYRRAVEDRLDQSIHLLI